MICEDRDRLSSGSDPREPFIQWQKEVERGWGNRVQPTLQTLCDYIHTIKELAQTQGCLELPLLQQAHLAMTLPSHSYCQSAVSPIGTWTHLSLPWERGPYLFLAGTSIREARTAQTGTKVRFLASANMHQRKQSGSGTGRFQSWSHKQESPGLRLSWILALPLLMPLSSLGGHGLS